LGRPFLFFEGGIWIFKWCRGLKEFHNLRGGWRDEVERPFVDKRGRWVCEMAAADAAEECQMNDRTAILESALDSLPDGIVLFGLEGEVVFWNQAAAAITGYQGVDVMGRPPSAEVAALLPPVTGRGTPVRAKHKLGHEVQVMSRALVLLDILGERIGMAALFHPAESLDALPHGDTGEDEEVGASQAELEERLESEFEDFVRGGAPFGVLWVSVDQAHAMRKSHGKAACDAMLEKILRALALGLRPAEEVGRWGEDEFLIISHERTAEMLEAHAKALTGLARTADFRWWGDRVSLTVSIGAAQATSGDNEGLAQLLQRAQKAMESSVHAGGNGVMTAQGRQACLPS
jgi:diguanylate cyclase (GGDEF)-like protein